MGGADVFAWCVVGCAVVLAVIALVSVMLGGPGDE